MEEIPCLCCGTYFLPRNRNQQYCSLQLCQGARKRDWQREKLRSDPEYRASQRLSQKKWLKDNPDYWKNYRRQNPDKASRNRILQRIRNKRSARKLRQSPRLIAKMDASNARAGGLSGHYWLVPEIAKMDAVKIYLHAIPVGCESFAKMDVRT